MIQLGYLLHGATPENRARFLAKLPLPARLLWRTIGRRRFTGDYTEIHGHRPTA